MIKLKYFPVLIAVTLSATSHANLVTIASSSPQSGAASKVQISESGAVDEPTSSYDSTSYAMPRTALKLKKDVAYEYLELNITKSQRLKVLDDGTILFTVYPKTLEQNARDLLAHTKGANLWVPKNFPKALRMFNSFQLQGDDVLDILDQMIAPFYDKRNVVGDYYPNKVVTLQVGN
ncbi:hypothetical protein K08M3_50470 [Vibrio alginolyticus]|jgi:hypothetical protein|uniref:Uncharacterized protein n=1 Tax=Vibrio alginolyticus TaxID=663 RepID=A0A1W6UV29_VIBAL|nr:MULTISPECIES: hypothetical protein [Vibrio harveyi group]ARP06557.1 hypothetical protein K04M1_50340 [Vibrio alginolyticus]ARP11690.1 hypothetical protein K04M3_51210 [Vibrio alginolyticus]ARP16743.1 hypothetical protein K04M5_50910 [Vibrio alginolyticus]ARP21780.1 hypothetical protein K05K4_50780 [Vibrio alginolyticus]ARP26843.1 hypothetical protein K06K5_50430 [Vibrio alginolyticus]